MALTFDGTNRLIIESDVVGDTAYTAQSIYSDWKEWVLTGVGALYAEAFTSSGGEPIGGGKYTGQTYVLVNNWKFKPAELDHTVTITGNLFASGGDAVVPTDGNFTVDVVIERAAEAQGIATGGGDTNAIAQAVWEYAARTLTEASGGGANGSVIDAIIGGGGFYAEIARNGGVGANIEAIEVSGSINTASISGDIGGGLNAEVES